jgi:hypothetical protein
MIENSKSIILKGLFPFHRYLEKPNFRLLSEYGRYGPSRVRISISPPAMIAGRMNCTSN